MPCCPVAREAHAARGAPGTAGRTQEIKRLIGRSLLAAVDLTLLGERQIIVAVTCCRPTAARTASINGGFVALALACGVWWPKGVIAENPVKRTIAAVSVGMVGDAYLDLDYRLDLAADVDFSMVMTDDERFVEVQGGGR
ncbi:MAG: hypothetical protein R2838_18205 [Caldilineaceae bacterium]